MKRINLRKYYPYSYSHDVWIFVSDEVAEDMDDALREMWAQNAKIRYYKAYFSLDRNDGIEREAVHKALSPDDILMLKLKFTTLYSEIQKLPEKQARRLYARFFLGLDIKEIARQEGVKPNSRTVAQKSVKKPEKNYCKGVIFRVIFLLIVEEVISKHLDK